MRIKVFAATVATMGVFAGVAMGGTALAAPVDQGVQQQLKIQDCDCTGDQLRLQDCVYAGDQAPDRLQLKIQDCDGTQDCTPDLTRTQTRLSK